MANIRIRIETGNAAFRNDPAYEVARIFRSLANLALVNGLQALEGKNIMDANGNTVGRVEISS